MSPSQQEYCCHKVDKVRTIQVYQYHFELTLMSLQRISEIIKRRNKQRLAKAAALAKKEAAGDFSHLKNKKGEFITKPLPQPTLPNVSLDDDDTSFISRVPPSTGGEPYYNDPKPPVDYSPVDYPPMPPYNHPYYHSSDGYNQYNPSVGTLQDEHQQAAYDDDYGSQIHLTSSAAPFARTHEPHGSALSNPYSPGLGSSNSQQAGLAYEGYDEGAMHDQYASPGSENPPHHPGMFYPETQHHGQQSYMQPQGQYEYYHGQPGDDQYDYNPGQAHAM